MNQNTDTPSSEQFRLYADYLIDSLAELDKKYPRYHSMKINGGRHFREQIDLVVGSYSRDLDNTMSNLRKHHADVSGFWENDLAFRLALRKAKFASGASNEQLAHEVTERIINIWRKAGQDEFNFARVRESMERRLKWVIGLSLFAEKYLDGSLYRGAIEAREKVIEARLLTKRLSELLHSEGLSYMRSHLPKMGHDTIRLIDDLRENIPLFLNAIEAPEIEAIVTHRRDDALTARLVASEILIVNYATFRNSRKDLTQLLMGMGFIGENLEIEPKTIERIWNRLLSENDRLHSHLGVVMEKKRKVYRDRKTPRMPPFYDPRM